MERLEAALEKARESRRALQSEKVRSGEAMADGQPAAVRSQPPEAAELWHKLPTISLSAGWAKRHRISTLAKNESSGHYDMLRSRMLRMMQDNGWQSVAITSPNAACGKTTVCANLAFSLARQTDLKILVLDLDLRRPSLQKLLGHKPSANFHDVLEGRVRIEDQLVRYGDNLAFGLNSKHAHHPSELLQSRRTLRKLEQVKAMYEPDLIVFDLPPMMASDDHLGFLPHVDCGVLVNAAESTTIAQLDACEKELSELTNVLGVVLNKCRFNSGDSEYDQDYY